MIKRIPWLFIALLCACGKPTPPEGVPSAPERIVSLAPNITDTLYDLQIGKRLVGISRFSSDERHSDLPVVGDFLNINYEAVVALRPDLVILEKSAEAQKTRLESLGIPYLETCSLSIGDILASIRAIGSACKTEKRATEVIHDFRDRMNALKNTPPHRPRTLMIFSDFSGRSKVEQVYAFGAGCIHSEMLAIAGGDNVITDARPSITLSREAVIRLDPELIIELSAGGPTNDWANLPTVDAVRNNRIHVLDGTYTTIPAPNCLLKTLEDLSVIIKETNPTQ